MPTVRHHRRHTRLIIRLAVICLLVGGALVGPGSARAGYGVGPSSQATGTSPTFTVFLGSNDSLATVYVAASTAMSSFSYFPTQELGSCTPAATAAAGTYTCQPSFYSNSPSFASTLPPGTYYWWLTFYENFKLQISGPLMFTVAQPVAPTGISLTSPVDGATVSPSVSLTAHLPAGTNYSIDVSDINDREGDGSAVVPTFSCKGTASSDGNYSCAGTSAAPLLPYLTYYWWVVVTTADGSTFVFGPRSFLVATPTIVPTPTPVATTAAPTPTPTPTPSIWLTTSAAASASLKGRFANIETAACSPDTSSGSRVIGTVRWWQRFLCAGETYGGASYSLTFKAAGQCSTCWTISNLSGVSASGLQVKSSPPPTTTPAPPAKTTGGGSAETPERVFATVASGVLKVASSCNSGSYSASAFLVGPQTVVTDLHVVQDPNGSPCSSTAKQEGTGRTARITNWTAWQADDLAVAHLSSPITGHDFSLSSVAPSVGSKISGLGYSLGNPLSFNQGTLLNHITGHGIPYLELNLLGAHGSSGGPILNSAGSVVGVTDLGIANDAGLTNGIKASVIVSINLATFARGGPGMCKGVATESANTLCGSLK